MNLKEELKAAMALEQDLISRLAKAHGVVDFLMFAVTKEKENAKEPA